MGQKVSPHGLRVGVIKDWNSKWYADKNNFADYLIEDNKVREYVKKKLYVAGVSKVVLERQAADKVKVIVRFKGREMAHQDIGRAMLEKFLEACSDAGSSEKGISLDGRFMSTIIAPNKK